LEKASKTAAIADPDEWYDDKIPDDLETLNEYHMTLNPKKTFGQNIIQPILSSTKTYFT